MCLLLLGLAWKALFVFRPRAKGHPRLPEEFKQMFDFPRIPAVVRAIVGRLIEQMWLSGIAPAVR